MDISNIKQLVAEDMPIDDTELDIESMAIPQLHSKYLNIYMDEKLLLQKINSDYYRLKKMKWEYYTGKLDQDQLDEYGWEPFQLKILKQEQKKLPLK